MKAAHAKDVSEFEDKSQLAKDQDVKQFLGDIRTTVQNRLKTAQDIMAKVYGDRI